MSHVRKLFHKSYRTGPLPAPLAPVPVYAEQAPVQQYGSNGAAVADLLGKAPGLTDYPVEHAQVRPKHRLVFYTDSHSPAADRFRYLRMRLREPWSAGKLKRLLITSSLAHEGKSTVVLNLATALAERGRRAVLLIEADLHKSCIVEKLGLKAWAGVGECLHGHQDPLSVIRRVDPFGWYLLPAGEPTRNATEVLHTPAFAAIMQRVSPHFDWVLIDSPPVVPRTDAMSLQQHADGSLLVVRAGSTPREAVDQATALLGSEHVVGIVLNGVEPRDHIYGRYQ